MTDTPIVTRACVARAALTEAGRPDLAAWVGTNAAGRPTRSCRSLPPEDGPLIWRAWDLANRADHLNCDEPHRTSTWTTTVDEITEWCGQPCPWMDPWSKTCQRRCGERHWNPYDQSWQAEWDEDIALDWRDWRLAWGDAL